MFLLVYTSKQLPKHKILTKFFRDLKFFDTKFKTQYSQHKTRKRHICVHTPKPKLDIVLNVEKLKHMDKVFMIWKFGHKHTNTYIQLNTLKNKNNM